MILTFKLDLGPGKSRVILFALIFGFTFFLADLINGFFRSEVNSFKPFLIASLLVSLGGLLLPLLVIFLVNIFNRFDFEGKISSAKSIFKRLSFSSVLFISEKSVLNSFEEISEIFLSIILSFILPSLISRIPCLSS